MNENLSISQRKREMKSVNQSEKYRVSFTSGRQLKFHNMKRNQITRILLVLNHFLSHFMQSHISRIELHLI